MIYLSDQRGISRSPRHESLHSFDFGSYKKKYHHSFKSLSVFNEDTLNPQSTLTYSVPPNHVMFVLPLVGGIKFNVNQSESSQFIEAGQSLAITVAKTSIVMIANPYHSGPVNFISCWFSNCEARGNDVKVSSFYLEDLENALTKIFSNEMATAHLGRFTGRGNFNLKLQRGRTSLFVFVVEGAFEVEKRLLQPKDGLSIENVTEVEFEALSNGAIILIFELVDRS